MSENITNETNSTQEAKGEKTFTQDDVNRIVSERLSKEKNKTSETREKEKELEKREFRLNNRQKLIDRGYPESLMDALNCNDENAFNKALEIVDGLLKERGLDFESLASQKKELEEQKQAEAERAKFVKFTCQLKGKGKEEDPIKQAMNL